MKDSNVIVRTGAALSLLSEMRDTPFVLAFPHLRGDN